MNTQKILFILFLLLPLLSSAQIRLPRLFVDHAVLQREVQLPVWGWAKKGDKIQVTFNGNTAKTETGKDGKWKVTLPAMAAGGPFTMTISNGKETRTLHDILLGDVWICSGQSNMEWLVKNSNNAKTEIANGKDAQIRHFKVPHTHLDTAQDTLAGGEWVVCTPETVGDFTAVGYFFARELRKVKSVPIGLLNTSWGGSRIEPWMREEAIASIPGFENAVKDRLAIQKKKAAETFAALEKMIGPLPKTDAGMAGGKPVWANPQTDVSGWKEMNLPRLWESRGLPDLDGVVWFRTSIELNDQEASEELTLHLGPIDDSDITWINGKEVGRMEQRHNIPRVYKVNPDVLTPGKNVIVVRVHDTGGGGGIYGKKEEMYAETAFGKYPLHGNWKFKVGEAKVFAGGSAPNQTPVLLYNGMVAPLIPFGIKGAIWYQGESNASEPQEYQKLFPKMIEDWRSLWGQGDFPFLWVQLANFMSPRDMPSESNWAALREAQSMTLSVPNTAEAVIIDIGEANDIHPRNKQSVGLRLALAARKLAYDDSAVPYSGPRYQSMKMEGETIRISFDHTAPGMYARDKYGYLKGFAIAGKNKKFTWAMARIEGDEIVVWSSTVKNPVAVRYGWADNPDDANLYNYSGLPASPFRTDDW